MMKFYKLIGVLILLILFIGCSDEDPLLPLPEVNFRTNPEIIEVGIPVVFENLTTNASSYEWDFGDGQTSTAISPIITYEESGPYTVKLVAITDDDQRDSLSMDIDVGERVMKELYINDIPFYNQENNDWDDPTGLPDSTKYPDLILLFGPEDSDNPDDLIITLPVVDLAPFDMPIYYTLEGGDPYVLTDEDWVLEFYDFDGDDIENAQNEDFEIMGGATFNPVTIPTSTVNEDGEGLIQLSFNQFSIYIVFQIE